MNKDIFRNLSSSPKDIKVQFARDFYHLGRVYHIALAKRMYDFYKSSNLLIANNL
jgi:hypothetical protein